ncbi:MAG: cytochrome c [Rhodobacteraceae bacterium]|nr:cytochrome c [Paracoccaceae bacterium]
MTPRPERSKWRRLLIPFGGLCLAGFAAFWGLTMPQRLDADALAGMDGDPARGERVFHLGGCAACHAAPSAEGDARLVLAGGMAFPSPFGTFRAPNISPDPDHGIGGWSAYDLVNAMRYGTAPDGRHYYPAFPYTSYIRASTADIVDLKAFLDTLPPSATPSAPHEVGFPFNIRRGLGLWKLLFLNEDPAFTGDPSDQARRGQALAEGLGHCGECHTPRGALGQTLEDAWLQGAPHPSGKGKIPALAGLDWSAADIAAYLKTGFTPEFDTAGAEMAEVIQNLAQLPDEDRAAIAAYIKALPAP